MLRENRVVFSGTGPQLAFKSLSFSKKSVVSFRRSSKRERRGFSNAVQIKSIGRVGALQPLRTGLPCHVPVRGCKSL